MHACTRGGVYVLQYIALTGSQRRALADGIEPAKEEDRKKKGPSDQECLDIRLKSNELWTPVASYQKWSKPETIRRGTHSIAHVHFIRGGGVASSL